MHQIVYNLIRKRKWLNDFIVFSKFFTWVRSNIQRIYSNTFLKLCTQWAKNVEKKVHLCRTNWTCSVTFHFFEDFMAQFFLTWKRSRKAVQKNLPPFIQYTILSPFQNWNLQGNLSFFSGNPDSVNTIYCRMYWRTGK